jgi:FkbM family methyltransferase
MKHIKRAIKYILCNTFLKNIYIKKRLPRKFSNTYIFVTPSARLKFLKPGKSVFRKDYSGLMYLADSIVEENDKVWDIGANIGIFTFAAARKVGSLGEVISVEADTFLVQLLRKSKQISSNEKLNVKVLPAAISSEDKISSFMISAEGRNTSFLKSELGQFNRNYASEVFVPTYKLDTLKNYFRPPDVLKIDVEGAEYKVISGAKEMIAKNKPKIYCEVSEVNIDRVTKILSELGYNLYKIENGSIKDIEECVFNTLAIPN